MKSKGRPKSASTKRRASRWPFWLAGAIALLAGLIGWQIWRTTPAPPEINTTGYDPLVAEAITQARNDLLKTPRSADAWGQLGRVLLAHEIRAPARVCFTEAARLAPREPRWPYFYGISQLIDNPMAAATRFAQVLPLFAETNFAPRLRLADTLLSLGRLEEAEAHYRHVWQHETNSALAALGLGKVAMAQNKTAEAATFLDAATDHPSTRKAAYRLLVNLHQREGRTVQSEQAARILESLPDDEALPDPYLAEVDQLKTGEKVWTDLADEWIKIDRAADAARLLEKTLRSYPKSDRAMFFLGRARLRLGDPAGAEAILMRAVELAPDSVETQMQLGVLRLGQRRGKAAQPCFRAAIRAKPNLAEAWFNLGLTLGTDINRADSMAAFREAIRLKPNLIDAYLGLAVVLRMDGQKKAAADELRRALELQPEEPLRQRLLEQLKLAEQP